MERRSSHSSVFFDRDAKITLAVTGLVWLLAVLGGGSARADVPHVLLLRLAAIVGIAMLVVFLPRDRLQVQRAPLVFFGATAALIATQLIPLPFSVWTALPGREPYARLSAMAGLGDIWRPLSLSPDLTWNSLLSLFPALFFIIAVPALGRRTAPVILAALLVTILFSALLGLLQIGGGPQTVLRHYPVTNTDSAVGFFANRNHQAVFLAMGIPLALWWGVVGREGRRSGGRFAIAGSLMLFLLTAVVTTQSRMGSVVAGVSLLLSGVYFFKHVPLKRGKALAWGAVGLVIGIALAVAAFNTWAENRLDVAEAQDDLRLRILPESIAAATAFFPAGAGFGTFAHVFPRFESVEDLRPTYVNHTHSEITQIPIEGGIVGALLLLLFLGWLGFTVLKVWRPTSNLHQPAEARVCSIVVALPLLASITDYPLRAPLMACAFTVVAMLMALSGPERARSG